MIVNRYRESLIPSTIRSYLVLMIIMTMLLSRFNSYRISPMINIISGNKAFHITRIYSSKEYKRPDDIYIPLDKIEFSFARSSGPGGQNVNKLNTKAEIRFNIESADWIPNEVKQRLIQYQSNKINKDGELLITSQEHRTQGKNKDDCISKLQYMLAEAYIEPKDRHMWEGISEKGKEIRREDKRKRGEVKSQRRNSKNFDYDD